MRSGREEESVGDAVRGVFVKYGRPMRLIVCPTTAEAYPHEWNGIPIRPDIRVPANHLYLLFDAVQVEES